MTSRVALYQTLTSAPDDRIRFEVIAEPFERLEDLTTRVGFGHPSPRP